MTGIAFLDRRSLRAVFRGAACLAVVGTTPAAGALNTDAALEKMVCTADVIATIEVISGTPPEDLPGTRHNECDVVSYETAYRVRITKTFVGDLDLGVQPIRFVHRSSPNCSLEYPTSGIEHILEPGQEYLALLKVESGAPVTLLRADTLDQKDRIQKVWKGLCAKKPAGPNG